MKVIEEWKAIKDFEGYYISNLGRVKSTRAFKGTKELFLKGSFNQQGYKIITMMKNKKAYTKTLHRLLAIIFINNPSKLPCVNHIDGNILNNSLENLEWCTYGHNEKEAYRLGLKEPRLKSKPILQTDKLGNVIRRWANSYEPKQIGYNPANINMCCNGKRKTANGFIWRFANE